MTIMDMDTETDSHDCGLCGRTYRSRGAALRCCTDRFDDSDDSDFDPNADAVAREDGGRTLAADGGSEIQRSHYHYGDSWSTTFRFDGHELYQRVVALDAVANPARFEFTPENITAHVVDPANIRQCEIVASGISDSDVELTVGLRIDQLKNALGALAMDSRVGDGCLELTCDASSDDEAAVVITDPDAADGRDEFEIEALNVDSVRDKHTPDYEYDSSFRLPAWKLHGAVAGVAAAADRVIKLQTRDGRLEIIGDDGSEGRFTAGEEWWLDLNEGTIGDSEALYPKEYLVDMVAAFPGEDSLTVRFASDRPLELDAGDIRYTLANRVEPKRSTDSDARNSEEIDCDTDSDEMDDSKRVMTDGGSEPMERIADALELQNAILQQLVLETHRGYQHHRDEGRSPKSVSTSVIDRHGELYGFRFGDDTPVVEEVLGR